MGELWCCPTNLDRHASHLDKSRDALKALIHLEQRHYQRTNYLSPQINECDEDEDGTCGGSSSLVVDERRPRSSSSVDMIAEMANLVTDLRLASPPCSIDKTEIEHHQPHDRWSQKQQESCIRTPESGAKSRLWSFRYSHSPNSSTDSIYRDVSDEASYSPNRSRNNNLVKQRRTTALHVSCLKNWRHQMLDWTCTLCQSIFPSVGRTVVAVAFNILDRYISNVLAREQHEKQYLYGTVQDILPFSKEDFQLFCMVSLYIAAKLWIPANQNQLTISNLVAISQGLYSTDIVCATECHILLAVDWHINPPTVMDFCNIYIDLLFIDPPYSAICAAIRHKCEYYAEMALDDIYFLDKNNSVVALAIVLLLIDDFRGRDRYKSQKKRLHRDNDDILTAFLRNIQGLIHISNDELDSILRRLEYFV